MRQYRNGDRCPCCGTVLQNKSPAWLAAFSQLVHDLSLRDWPQLPEIWDAPELIEEQAEGEM